VHTLSKETISLELQIIWCFVWLLNHQIFKLYLLIPKMRFLVPIFYNVKSVISSLPLKEWQKMLQTIKKINFVESWTYESVKFLFMKINCQLYKSQTYKICTRLHKIYKLDNFRAKSCTTWSENYCEYFWLYKIIQNLCIWQFLGQKLYNLKW